MPLDQDFSESPPPDSGAPATTEPTCDVCGEPIYQDEGYLVHARLRARIHMACPLADVMGEDVSTHTMMFVWPHE